MSQPQSELPRDEVQGQIELCKRLFRGTADTRMREALLVEIFTLETRVAEMDKRPPAYQ
jgi:hypothetical protein